MDLLRLPVITLRSPLNASSFPKPVYVMHTLPADDGAREDLVVTHAESERTWILSSKPDRNGS